MRPASKISSSANDAGLSRGNYGALLPFSGRGGAGARGAVGAVRCGGLRALHGRTERCFDSSRALTKLCSGSL